MNYEQIRKKSAVLLAKQPITIADHLEYLKLFQIAPSWLGKVRFHFSKEKVLFELYLRAKALLEKAPCEIQEAFELLVKAVFSSERAQQLQFKKKNISPEKQLQERFNRLRDSIISVHPALLEPFFSSIEKLHDVRDIDLQEKLLLKLSQRMHARERQLLTVIDECFAASSYPDIATDLNRLSRESFIVDTAVGTLLTEEKSEAIFQNLQQFCEIREKQAANLLREKKERKKFFEENNAFIKSCEARCVPFSFFKDLKPLNKQIETLLSQLKAYEVQMAQIAEEEVRSYFAKSVEESGQKHSEIEKLFSLQSQKELQLTQDVTTITQTIKRRLFEVFSKNTPFPDLKPTLESLHNSCVAEMQKLQKKFFSSALTLQEYQSAAFALAYDHDVKQLRKDVMFRSTRLKELRQECLKQCNELCRYIRYMKVCGEEKSELCIQGQELSNQIYDLFSRVREPFELFIYADEVTYESANAVFRAVWVELEEYQAQVKECVAGAKNLLKPHRKVLERAFFRCVSDIEEVLKAHNKLEKQLVPTLQGEFQEVKDAQFLSFFEEKIVVLENMVSFAKPFSFFLHCDFHEERVSLLKENYALEMRVKQVFQFAKTLQSVKLYEEERVDEILEGLEELYTISDSKSRLEDAFKMYYNKLIHAADSIEREVVLEIGLVDRRAILDIEEKKLKNVLQLGIRVGQRKLQTQPEAQFSETVLEEADTDTLLTMLRTLCHQFFAMKVTKAYALKSRSGYYESLIATIRQVLHSVRCEMKEHDVKNETFHAASAKLAYCRELTERLELQEESIEAFNPILTDILNALQTIEAFAKLAFVEKFDDFGADSIFEKSDILEGVGDFSKIESAPKSSNFSRNRSFARASIDIVSKASLTEQKHNLLVFIDELRSKKEFINNSTTLLHYLPGCLRYFDF